MGIDLRLLPIDFLSTVKGDGVDKKWGYSHTILNVPRHYRCWDDIGKLPAIPLTGWDIGSHIGRRIPDGPFEGEPTYGPLTTDPYGQPYQAVAAKDLAPILRKHFPDHSTTAYVNALPPDDLIVLGWH